MSKVEDPRVEKLELLLSKAEAYSRFLFSKRREPQHDGKASASKGSPSAKRRRSVDTQMHKQYLRPSVIESTPMPKLMISAGHPHDSLASLPSSK